MSPTTEIIPANELPKNAKACLKDLGAKLKPETVVAALVAARNGEVSAVVRQIQAGAMLLALKADTPHGKWMRTMEDIAKMAVAKFATHCEFENKAIRTLDVYMHLARNYLNEIFPQVTAGAAEDAGKKLPPVDLPKAFALALADKPANGQSLTEWVGGRSLSQILRDLRAAERDAAAEENPPTPPEETPPAPDTPADPQLEFNGFFTRTFKDIRNRMSVSDGLNLPPTCWETYAAELIRLGKEILHDKCGKDVR